MALAFPNSPSVGAQYSSGGVTWQWDGTTWNIVISGGGGGASSMSFATISVAGQDNVLADSTSDTLTLVAASGMTITTDAATDTVTFASSGGGGGGISLTDLSVTTASASGAGSLAYNDGTGVFTFTPAASVASTFASLSDVASSGTTIADVYLPAITKLVVTNIGTSAYLFDQYADNNATIYVISGTTIAFRITSGASHPFQIQNAIGTAYNTGLVHVSDSGTVTTGAAANGATSGVLYWKVPSSLSGGYRYQCTNHAAMVGSIFIKSIAAI